MDKFIFDESKQSWEQYLSGVKRIINPSCITTNETALEDKRKEYDINNNSSISFEAKNGGLFSDNEDENFDDF